MQCMLRTSADGVLRDAVQLHLSGDPTAPGIDTPRVSAMSYSVDTGYPLGSDACPQPRDEPSKVATSFDTDLRVLVPDVPEQCVSPRRTFRKLTAMQASAQDPDPAEGGRHPPGAARGAQVVPPKVLDVPAASSHPHADPCTRGTAGIGTGRCARAPRPCRGRPAGCASGR